MSERGGELQRRLLRLNDLLAQALGDGQRLAVRVYQAQLAFPPTVSDIGDECSREHGAARADENQLLLHLIAPSGSSDIPSYLNGTAAINHASVRKAAWKL